METKKVRHLQAVGTWERSLGLGTFLLRAESTRKVEGLAGMNEVDLVVAALILNPSHNLNCHLPFHNTTNYGVAQFVKVLTLVHRNETQAVKRDGQDQIASRNQGTKNSYSRYGHH